MVSSLVGGSRQRTTRMRSGAKGSRDSVISHLTQGWIPVNPKILRMVRQHIQSDAEDREKLIELISHDPALLLFVNTELFRISGSSRLISPDERISNASVDDLIKIFPQNVGQISKHSLDKISPSQSGQLQRTLVATKAAASLAEIANENVHDAEFGVVFSDLGRQLVAWNYPQVYTRALSIQRAGLGELDGEIERILGINPDRVAGGLAVKCGVPSSIQKAFNDRGASIDSADEVTLADIISYGRLFSEKLDAKNFAQSERKFEQLEEKLSQKLGDLPDTQEVEASAEEALSQYKGVVTGRSRLTVGGWKPEQVIDPTYTLEGCSFPVPPVIRDQVKAIFERIQSEADCITSLSTLVDTIIPKAGFTNGCIYVVSGDQQKLVPQMVIGPSSEQWTKSISLSSDSDIVRALFSYVSVKDVKNSPDGQPQFYYTAGIQCKNFDGVLVLCANVENIRSAEETTQFDCFRAIQGLFEMMLASGSTS